MHLKIDHVDGEDAIGMDIKGRFINSHKVTTHSGQCCICVS